MTALDSLSSRQKAELLLEINNLSNETLVRLALEKLGASSPVEELGSFFDRFVKGAKEVITSTTFSSLIFSLKNKKQTVKRLLYFSSKT